MAQGRAKRPHKKTKTGCMTCRKRRIKCDEAKPACRQCTDSLRKCEGYQPPQTWLFKPRNPPEQSQANMNLIHFVAPMTAMGDSEDKRSFQFWIEQAAPLFSCYFGHSFWTQLLPQIGLVRPAVKHMLLVTSSVVENTALEGAPLDENQVYQSHYTKAIQATCSSPQVENVLLACLLFACCDFMRGSYESGLRHIRSGLSIIDEWYHSIQNSDLKASPSARLIINAIGPIFVSYVDKSPTYGFGDITVDTCACAGFLAPSLELPYIAPFNHIHGAHHALDGIAHYVARLMDWRKKSWTPAPPQKIQMLLDTWRITIDRFEANLTKAKKDAHAMILSYLRVYHTMFGVMVRASTGNSEAMYEKFDEEFRWIVDRYDDFANLWAEDDTLKFSSGTWANLDYHFGFIPALFFTATKCRDPKTRMAALNHLGSLRVEEQNWTSCAAYVIAKKMIQIETNLSIINDRTGLRDERDLIRPIEAYITDKRMTQAGLDYAVHPFLKEEEPLTQHETIDLSECLALSSSSARWPLARILRIGGYQGGGIIPTPTNCHCHFHFQSSGTMLLYRPRT